MHKGRRGGGGGVVMFLNRGLDEVNLIEMITIGHSYHWRELPQVSFSSRERFCCNKHVFVATNVIKL